MVTLLIEKKIVTDVFILKQLIATLSDSEKNQLQY